MPINITYTSSHPDFLDFGDWLQKKSDDALAAGDNDKYQQIHDAVAKKKALNVSAPPPITSNHTLDDDTHTVSVSLTEVTVDCPEFNYYWDQWLAEFNVNVETSQT